VFVVALGGLVFAPVVYATPSEPTPAYEGDWEHGGEDTSGSGDQGGGDQDIVPHFENSTDFCAALAGGSLAVGTWAVAVGIIGFFMPPGMNLAFGIIATVAGLGSVTLGFASYVCYANADNTTGPG